MGRWAAGSPPPSPQLSANSFAPQFSRSNPSQRQSLSTPSHPGSAAATPLGAGAGVTRGFAKSLPTTNAQDPALWPALGPQQQQAGGPRRSASGRLSDVAAAAPYPSPASPCSRKNSSSLTSALASAPTSPRSLDSNRSSVDALGHLSMDGLGPFAMELEDHGQDGHQRGSYAAAAAAAAGHAAAAAADGQDGGAAAAAAADSDGFVPVIGRRSIHRADGAADASRPSTATGGAGKHLQNFGRTMLSSLAAPFQAAARQASARQRWRI